MTRQQRNKRTVIIFISILGLIALIFAAAVLYDRYAPTHGEDEIVFLSVESEKIVGLSFDYAGAHTHLALENGVWISEHEADVPLNQAKVALLVSAVSHIEATRRFVPESEDFGFDKPIRIIEILLADGSAKVVTIGSQNPQTFELYCRLDGSREVYLISSSAFSDFDANVQSLAQYETIPTVLPTETISLEVNLGGKKLVLTRHAGGIPAYDYRGSRIWLAALNSDAPFAADSGGVAEYIVALTSMTFEYLAVSDASESDLVSYGFSKPSMSVTLTYYEDGAQKVYTLLVGTITEDGYSAVKPADSSRVYFVSTEALDVLRGMDVEILVNRAACGISKDYIESLSVQYEGTSRAFTVATRQTVDAEGNETTEYYYTSAGADVDTASFETFLHTMLGLTYQETAEKTLGNRIFSVTFATKSTYFPSVDFALYEYDDSFYASVINGEPPLLINKRYVQELLSFYGAIG